MCYRFGFIISRVDILLFVSRFNETKEAAFDQTIDNLKSIHARIIGTVMMAFDHSRATDYYASTYYKQDYASYYQYVEEKN